MELAIKKARRRESVIRACCGLEAVGGREYSFRL